MVSLRVSLVCLLLFSSGCCFPKPGEDDRYPNAATWGFGGSSPGSNLPSAQAVNYQQPPQGPSAPTGNHSPSSVGAHSVVVSSSPRYEPSGVHVSSGTSSNKPFSAPEIPSQGAGYVSPSGPASTGSFSVQPQPSGTSGPSNMGSVGVASSPVYGASLTYSAPGYGASPSYYGTGSVNTAPATFNYGAGSSPSANINTGPATLYPADTSRYAEPAPETSNYGYYDAAPEISYGAGDGSVPDLPWVVQPVEASFSDPSNWMPRGDFPDFSVWQSGANSKMSRSEGETPPVPSSTYIIQSGNGYMRALQHQSHANYAPEDPEPRVFLAEPVRAQPTKTRPAAPKGGKKI